ncbi:hypothetical protein C6341_g24419 [Phytophthora cactorum]|nr:hypothetical protein C6341_g24419 [Phytophthora cactorum]
MAYKGKYAFNSVGVSLSGKDATGVTGAQDSCTSRCLPFVDAAEQRTAGCFGYCVAVFTPLLNYELVKLVVLLMFLGGAPWSPYLVDQGLPQKETLYSGFNVIEHLNVGCIGGY